MKKVFFYFFSFFILSVLNAQWMQQVSGVPGNLYDVKFLNSKTGWALGDDGKIIKTTNAGINWVNVVNPAAGKQLSTICIVDSSTIYFCGYFETIIKTTNGGDNWIEIRNGPYGTGSSYYGIYFINQNTGWIAGSGSKILSTTNGGVTLDSTYLFWGTLNDFYFINATTGILCGDGNVFKTTNAGLSWYETNIPIGGTFSQFRRLGKFNNTVWAIGNDARVFKSTDFCETWNLIDTVEATEPNIIGVGFVNQNTGFAGGNYGKLYKTTNGGFSWKRENTGTDQRFISAVCFTNDTTTFICGGAGKMIYTEHGGLTNLNYIRSDIPENFELKQNYPNPFNSQTTIEFIIQKSDNYTFEIYNSLGQKIDTPFSKNLQPGNYKINYNANNLTSGIYFYRIFSEKKNLSKSFLLIK
jgi:photosystem II stability/assembly factor-like uncharacterized protein